MMPNTATRASEIQPAIRATTAAIPATPKAYLTAGTALIAVRTTSKRLKGKGSVFSVLFIVDLRADVLKSDRDLFGVSHYALGDLDRRFLIHGRKPSLEARTCRGSARNASPKTREAYSRDYLTVNDN